MLGFQSKFFISFFTAACHLLPSTDTTVCSTDPSSPPCQLKEQRVQEWVCTESFEVLKNKRDTDIYEEQPWKAEVCVDLGLRSVLTWHLPLLRFLTKFTHRVWSWQGWASSVIHYPSSHVVHLFANSHDRMQKASDGKGSFKCNDKRSHAFWTLLVGTYGVNNRWHPENDTEPAHFCFRRSFKMTAVAQHWEAYAVMYVMPLPFSVPYKE